MGSGASSMGFRSEAKRASPEVPAERGRKVVKTGPLPRSPSSPGEVCQKNTSSPTIHAANDEELEERLRFMERDSDLLLDDDEVLGNLDGYSNDADENKMSHESGASASGSSDGHQNNRESWNMLKHSLEVDDEEMMLNLLYFGEGGGITDYSALGKALDGAMTETFALHSENNTPYKLNPAKEEELASLTTEIMDESLSESMKDIDVGSLKVEEKMGEGPETMGCGVECVVCREEFELGQKLLKLPHCGHVFHAECLQKWFKHQNWCPVCRVSISGVPRGAPDGPSEASEKTPDKASLKCAGGNSTTSASDSATEGLTGE